MRVGSALGASRLVQGIGPILGPMFGGLLTQHAGPSGRFWILAATCLLPLALVAPLRTTVRRAAIA
ncbi:hypothetical protein [Frankia sp. Cr1]|uniref:hypothetical protein n=1 Tax=Frankia sp. Cr1 TaxID=3073931 RepID=UPI002AD2C741|nr:hypothetical protein [Frankia sp. Cr1]